MRDPIAIRINDVSKVYRLYGSQRDQICGVLGLDRIGVKLRTKPQEFAALRNVTLEVPRGHRIGIVGRNGAGKTTLLKLVCGNFEPSHGTVEVDGTVQALMSTGIGFHPEFTGRENVLGSLQYNGLGKHEYQAALDGIVDFCELGQFMDQPFRTYSLGMQARLMFATATAIRPDILIVDEILGAGDAYFVAKSKQRVGALVSSGCTMLLVSHSMHQVLELCDEVIWLDRGEVRMRGEAFLVVKAYEEFLQNAVHASALTAPPPAEAEAARSAPSVASKGSTPVTWSVPASQEPVFQASAAEAALPPLDPSQHREFACVAPGGVSRWPSDGGVRVCGFSMVTESGPSSVLHALRPCKAVIAVEIENAGDYALRYGVVFDDPMGRSAARVYSPCDRFRASAGGVRVCELEFNPLQLGPGEYTIGISVLEYGPIECLNAARRYDLLGRSFRVSVRLADSLGALQASSLLTGQWRFGNG